MTKLEKIIEYYPDEEFVSVDEFEDCIIGVIYDKSICVYKLVYSKSKCLEVLITRDKMKKETAEEFYNSNVESAYMGVGTPIWIDDLMFFADNIT